MQPQHLGVEENTSKLKVTLISPQTRILDVWRQPKISQNCHFLQICGDGITTEECIWYSGVIGDENTVER